MSKGTRIVKVRIPDDDSAERTVRYAAKQLSDGQELIVLDYSPVIPKAEMGSLVLRLATFVRVTEARFRSQAKSA